MDLTLLEPIQAMVEFDFGDVPAANLRYPLPQRLGEPPASPPFEVRGVRAATLDATGERDEYAFTLDRNDDNGVGLYVEFRLRSRSTCRRRSGRWRWPRASRGSSSGAEGRRR